jgi:hypothetical protein
METRGIGATGQVVVTALVVLLLSSSSHGQVPKWDVGGGSGLLFMHESEVASQQWDWNGNTEARADLGRYWTPHLKAGLAVSTSPRFRSYDDGFVIVGGVRRYAGIEVAARMTTFAPSITYQFLDNDFMHPYVTGGVRVGVVNVHRTRYASVYTDRGQIVDVPAIDERRTVLNARPFAAAGFKSYLNSRTFVRTEALTAFGAGGPTQITLHLGIGVDF